jgi:Tfp pilus assembly protein PilW
LIGDILTVILDTPATQVTSSFALNLFLAAPAGTTLTAVQSSAEGKLVLQFQAAAGTEPAAIVDTLIQAGALPASTKLDPSQAAPTNLATEFNSAELNNLGGDLRSLKLSQPPPPLARASVAQASSVSALTIAAAAAGGTVLAAGVGIAIARLLWKPSAPTRTTPPPPKTGKRHLVL